MDEREKLIEEVRNMFEQSHGGYEPIADFILKDRKRIIAPLKEVYPKLERNVNDEICFMCLNAITETLKLAGASHGE